MGSGMSDSIRHKCRDCGQCLPESEFGADHATPNGLSRRCRICKAKRSREWYYRLGSKAAHAPKIKKVITAADVAAGRKRRSLKSRYGLTVEEYNKILSTGCLICGTFKNLCVDHDHKISKNRGALCAKHNTAIGLFNENTDHLAQAIKYIQSFL